MIVTLSLIGSAAGLIAVTGTRTAGAWTVVLADGRTGSPLPLSVLAGAEMAEIVRRLDLSAEATAPGPKIAGLCRAESQVTS